MEVDIQRDKWGKFTLCPECVVRPPGQLDTDFLVCEECIAEWQELTGNGYFERCKLLDEE